MKQFPTRILMLLPAMALLNEGAMASSLAVDSPFLPPGFNPPGGPGTASVAPAEASQLEFKGVYQLNGKYYFHIYDTREQKGEWVREGEHASGSPMVVAYEEEEDVLVVDSGGSRLRLGLVATSDQPVPIAGANARTLPAMQASATASSGNRKITPTRRRVIRPTSRSNNPVTRRMTIRPTGQETDAK